MRYLSLSKYANLSNNSLIHNELTKLNYIRLNFISIFSLAFFTVTFLISYHSHFISKTDTSSFLLYSFPYSIAFLLNLVVQFTIKKPNLTLSKKIRPHLIMVYFSLMISLSTIISIFDLLYYNHLAVFLAYFILCTAILVLPLKKTMLHVSVHILILLFTLLIKNNWVIPNNFNLSLLLTLSIIIFVLSHYNYSTIYTSLLQHHLLVLEQEKSKLLTEKLHVVAHTDELTKLANRHGYYAYIENLENKFPLLLTSMILDIDYFKKYNDFYGHHSGDIALKKVADALYEICSVQGRYAVRWGGEEFLILLENHTDEEIQLVYEQFIARVKHLKIEHETSPIMNSLTFSVGSNTQIIQSSQDIENSLHLADAAQYQVKHSTKNNALFLKDGKIKEVEVSSAI